MLIGSESRNLNKNCYLVPCFQLQALFLSYIYSGKSNFSFVNSLIQKTIYESPKNSSHLCLPGDGAFIL